MQSLTRDQEIAVRLIMNIIETGSVDADYGSITVDKGGLTYGRNQTTENSGGLYRLLVQYMEKGDPNYVNQLTPYMNFLYSGESGMGKKGALSHNEQFAQLLKEIAQEDPVMGCVQDKYFKEVFYLPALDLLEEYAFQPLALSVATIYDTSIHSGYESISEHFLRAERMFDDAWAYDPNAILDEIPEDPDEGYHFALKYIDGGKEGLRIDYEIGEDDPSGWEKRMTLLYIHYRYRYLTRFTSPNKKNQEEVRRTVYRMLGMRWLAALNQWNLTPDIPFPVNFTCRTITQEHIDRAEEQQNC